MNYPDDIRSYAHDPRCPIYNGEEPKETSELIEELIGDDAFDFVGVLSADDVESINSDIGFCYDADGSVDSRFTQYLGEQVLKKVHEALERKVGSMGE